MNHLLTAQDVAALLRVPASWVYAEARAGRIPHIRIGRYRRFRPIAIQEWAQRLEQGPRASRSYGGRTTVGTARQHGPSLLKRPRERQRSDPSAIPQGDPEETR
jgi:excisionase family DNA binding protein